MAAPPSAYKDRHFLAVIGDEVNLPLDYGPYGNVDQCTGFGDGLATRWDWSQSALRILLDVLRAEEKLTTPFFSMSRSHQMRKRIFSLSTPRQKPPQSNRHLTIIHMTERTLLSCSLTSTYDLPNQTSHSSLSSNRKCRLLSE